MANLSKILDNYSIAEFKAMFDASNEKIEVVKNPKTGNLFMAISGKPVGAVAEKIDYSAPLQVLKVEDRDNPQEEVFILCNRNTDNIVVSI